MKKSLVTIRLELNAAAVAALERPVRGSGGFQTLLRKLQSQLTDENMLMLTPDLVAKIPRYFQDYGAGGFQGRLDTVLTELTALAKALRPMAA
jgi:hypothetical protein